MAESKHKKKSSKGSRVFLWIIIIILAAFSILFGGFGIFLTISNSISSSTSSAESTVSSTTTSEAEAPSNTIGSYTDKSFKGLTIESKAGETLTGKEIYDSARKSVMRIDYLEGGKIVYSGSAIVLTENGYLLTTASNVGASRDAVIKLTDCDNTAYEGHVVGFDNISDVAVVKIDADKLTPAELAATGTVDILDNVYAFSSIGAGEYNGSIVPGKVTALNVRLEYGSVDSEGYIQTNIDIPADGTGGALLNSSGQVVAMNLSKDGTGVDISGGCSLPISKISDTVTNIIKEGYVSGRVMLGIVGTPVTKDIADEYGVSQGIFITEIKSESVFKGTDVQTGDIITAIDGTEVTSFGEVSTILAKHKAGDKVKIDLYRIGQDNSITPFSVTVTLIADDGKLQN